MTRRLVIAVVLLSACGPKNPPENPSPPSEDAAVVETSIVEDASVPEVVTIAPPDSAAEPSCPKSFAAAQSSVCILTKPANPACEYSEGSCYCTEPPQCGGAYMMHPPGSPGTFACSPKSANVPRIDGCPWSPPKNGSACSGDKRCTYGPCSWSQTIATCQGGAWNVVVHQSPPPP